MVCTVQSPVHIPSYAMMLFHTLGPGVCEARSQDLDRHQCTWKLEAGIERRYLRALHVQAHSDAGLPGSQV